jgi:hypothetical protein
MSLQYCNKSKSQLTSPTPAQAASCCVISGTYSILKVPPIPQQIQISVEQPHDYYSIIIIMTSPTPAQLPGVAVSSGHIVYVVEIYL